jgi:hypothetical protein
MQRDRRIRLIYRESQTIIDDTKECSRVPCVRPQSSHDIRGGGGVRSTLDLA